MIKHSITLSAVALYLAGSSAIAQEGTLLVANREGGSISFFDLTTQVEIARVPMGPTIPHEVEVSPDGRWALTGEYGPNSAPGRRLVVIDMLDARVAGYIDLGPDSRPHDMMFFPDSRRAVATMQDSDRVAVVDVQDRKVLRTYPTGGREGHMVRVSPDASRAYVTSRGAEGTLSVIYLDEDREPTVIETGPGAEGIAITPDGNEVWVMNRAEESISVVDTRTLRVVDELPSRPFAGRGEASPDGRHVAVVNGMSGQEEPGYLRIYDVASRAVLHDVPIVGSEGTGGFGLLAHEDVVFLTTRSDGGIYMYDWNDPKEPKVLTTGHDGPDGMAWTPHRLNVFSD
jgi:YVTN family beta-propeller protein